jgi:hypothetical protein
MSDTNITCPKCGAELPLSEAVSHRVREQLEADFSRRLAESNAALQKREQQLAADRMAVEQRTQAIQAEIARQLESERKQLMAAAAREAEAKLSLQLQATQSELESQRLRLKQAQDSELALRRQQSELQAAKESLELDVARRLNEERQKIADAARQQGAEAERLKVADKDNVIKGLQEQIAALQQRAEQGSMQLQGETLELDLEAQLRAAFVHDDITEVKKGQRGADVNHRVRTTAGAECGTIVWEAKRAKNWSADWPEKLKADQRAAHADLAVIVTTCLPDGVRGFGLVEGVWVSEPLLAVALAAALRQGLISTAAQRVQQAGRADKAQALYDHLCSVEFRQHIEALVESFLGLKEQLESEQRAFARQWKEREQQLQKALLHTARLYGSIQGIAGRAALPEISTLALPGA